MEKYIITKIESTVKKYNLINIKLLYVTKISDKDVSDYWIVTLSGGKNGRGRFSNYLEDVKHVIDQFDHTWLIKWENDCLDDVWTLKFGIR